MSAPASSTRPPVTLLCGFLGAGKTTLLQHLLTQANGRRWALVVNDVAALNIDAALVRDASSAGNNRDLIALGGGCVCCSSRDELAETISELAASQNYDHILVETTGVAEPRSLANLFVQKNLFGRSLSDFATLSALVTVIDAAHFQREWRDYECAGGRAIVTATKRPLFELMLEQAECADVIVINKCDLLGADELDQLENVLRGLNARAVFTRATRGEVAADFLLDRPRFTPDETLCAATWLRTLNAVGTAPATIGKYVAAPGKPSPSVHQAPPAHETKYGLRSVIYQARRPFEREKFQSLILSGLPGLVRAKGFFWIQEQPDEMGFLSVAGGAVRFDMLNYWWAALLEAGKIARAELPEKIFPVWREPHGDRRQELVFIGLNLDEHALRAALDLYLLGEGS